MIVVGIDPHKHTHTAVAVDGGTGAEVATITVKARANGHERLLCWARSIDADRVFAVEDCRHVSGALQRFLMARGERMKRVPPKLMAGARRGARQRGKSDPIDARAVALAALREPGLPEASLEGVERDIRLLVDHREDLVAERTRICNRLRWHLHDLDPEFRVPTGGLDRPKWLARTKAHLRSLGDGPQARIAAGLVDRLGELTREANGLQRDLDRIVRSVAPELLQLPGCAALTAAKLLGETGGVRRFRSHAEFAMHAGVAPLEASSGERSRHRLNRTGNRQLNAALHRIALTQMRIHEPAKSFVERKQQQGHSTREALRCLKRHLARSVYRLLCANETRRVASITTTTSETALAAVGT